MKIDFDHVETSNPALLKLARDVLQDDPRFSALPAEFVRTAEVQLRIIAELDKMAAQWTHELLFGNGCTKPTGILQA